MLPSTSTSTYRRYSKKLTKSERAAASARRRANRKYHKNIRKREAKLRAKEARHALPETERLADRERFLHRKACQEVAKRRLFAMLSEGPSMFHGITLM
eukprot:g700.t1